MVCDENSNFITSENITVQPVQHAFLFLLNYSVIWPLKLFLQQCWLFLFSRYNGRNMHVN
jgi:hypothetical protein